MCVCVCAYCISEALESHVSKTSTARGVKTQVGHICEGLQVVASVLDQVVSP